MSKLLIPLILTLAGCTCQVSSKSTSKSSESSEVKADKCLISTVLAREVHDPEFVATPDGKIWLCWDQHPRYSCAEMKSCND